MCLRIPHTRSHPRISSSSIVHPSLCSASDRPRDVLPLCQVGSSFLPSNTFRVTQEAGNALSGHSSPILCASFSPTGNLLATGSGDATARLWDLFTETPSHTLSGHKDWVLCVEWEALERKLATGGHDSHVSFGRARCFFKCRLLSHPRRSEYGIPRLESLSATR